MVPWHRPLEQNKVKIAVEHKRVVDSSAQSAWPKGGGEPCADFQQP